MEQNSFKVINDQGQEIVCDVLFTFDSEETNKSYIVYTDNSTDAEGNVQVFASIYDPKQENPKLDPIETDAEWKNFHPSKRTLESCRTEFKCLKKIYQTNKQKITDIYDFAIFGEEDPIFNVTAQKKFYRERLKIIENARHNSFFRINSYEQIFDFIS